MTTIASRAATIEVLHGDPTHCARFCPDPAAFQIEYQYTDGTRDTLSLCPECLYDFLDLMLEKGKPL